MRAVIFANGLLAGWPAKFDIAPDEDMIIVADGGLNHCKQRGIIPHLVIGDMDSADPDDIVIFKKKGVPVNRYPVCKDETDLWLAVRVALDRQVDEIIILGGLGGRWDMTFSNVLLLASPELRHIEARILDGAQELFVLHNGKARIFGDKGDLLSLMPLTSRVKGLTVRGFAYPLDNEALALGTSRGISNVFVQEVCTIEFSSGKLLVAITHTHAGD